jgi:ribosomal protein S18 acetylase RimI-like enzyme
MTSKRLASLTPCNDREYAEFVSSQVVEYARQLALAGEVSTEQSVAAARERLQDLRADRLRGSGHHVLVARSEHDAVRVGWVWLSPAPAFLGPGHQHIRWLSQLTVEESCRGRGWGHAILAALEGLEAERGSKEIWLRVFDWNLAARRLYEAHGYELANQFATDAHLRKRLEHW